MVAVAGTEIASGLGDADDRLARLQLFQRQAEIHVALEIERGHVGIGGVVEPLARAQSARPIGSVLGSLARRHSAAAIEKCNTMVLT